MRKFHDKGRLCLIWGNHDINKKSKRFVQKNLFTYYNSQKGSYEPLFENIRIHEGLILKHLNKPFKVFIVHGHQCDLINDLFWPIARFLVRYVWKHFEMIGFRNPLSPASNYSRMTFIERKIIRWARTNKQLVIAGHTHRPAYPGIGKSPYFNSGCCVRPRYITGIEIAHGEIALVKWSIKDLQDQGSPVLREIVKGPEKLESFYT